jgi:hypothetical protein
MILASNKCAAAQLPTNMQDVTPGAEIKSMPIVGFSGNEVRCIYLIIRPQVVVAHLADRLGLLGAACHTYRITGFRSLSSLFTSHLLSRCLQRFIRHDNFLKSLLCICSRTFCMTIRVPLQRLLPESLLDICCSDRLTLWQI